MKEKSMNTKEIQDWLVEKISERLKISEKAVDIFKPFAGFGLTSSDVIVLSGSLEELLKRKLSPTLAFEYPNIHELATFLGKNQKIPAIKGKHEDSVVKNQEPIAVIGMAGRFPGADDLESFWHLLSQGKEAISEIPEDRWPKEFFYDIDPAVPGKAVSKWGGFLNNIDQFDPFFFGISPREAKQMDPQQRLLLELSFEAFDQAGFSKKCLDGTSTGVFVGIFC